MSTTPKSNREFPWIEPPPRNGTYTTHWDSGTVRVTGEYVDGLKQGSWKEYWPSGQLKQDYAWDRGLKHGHELDWSEEGVLSVQVTLATMDPMKPAVLRGVGER